MESLQLAQMLADISDLSAADARAAAAIVNANKTLPAQNQKDSLKPPVTASATMFGSRSSSSAANNSRLDKFGRRILTPPLTRSNSAQGSTPGTPRGSDPEDDIDRASTLMALYDIRNKLKQQDSTSLMRAREKIDAMIAKQRTAEGKQGDTLERPRLTSRYTYPKPDPASNPTK